MNDNQKRSLLDAEPTVRVTVNRCQGHMYLVGSLNGPARGLVKHPTVSMMESKSGRYALLWGTDENYKLSKSNRDWRFTVHGIPAGLYGFEIEGDFWILSRK